jgi:putative FmdB family regulatory protein
MVYFSIRLPARRSAVPLYEYKCQKCRRLTEKIENVSGPHLKKCPHCGGKVEVLISRSAIQFKGSGWYVTDYASKSSGSEASKDEKPAAENKDTSKDSAPKESQAKESQAKETSTKDKKTEKSAKKK